MSEIEVKALEWHTTEDVTQNTTGCIHYEIEHFSGGAGYGVYVHGWVGLHTGSFTTLDEAKAAAQSDYEARIRSALVSTPPAAPVRAFDQIVAARKAHVDAVAAYNARLELVRAERERGNWHIKMDREYDVMSEAQSAFIRTVQELADAALSASPSPVDSQELIERMAKAGWYAVEILEWEMADEQQKAMARNFARAALAAKE